MDYTKATTEKLVDLMHSGTRDEIKAASAEYWGRRNYEPHPEPDHDAIISVESPAEFTRRILKGIS